MSYFAEYAKSSRGKCKRFKTKIEKGQLKVGHEIEMNEGEMWKQWFSVIGFKDKMIFARTAVILDAENIEGFDSCTAEDQKILVQLVDDINRIKADKELKREHKESVAHLKSGGVTKKKKKTKEEASPKKKKRDRDEKNAVEAIADAFKGSAKDAMQNFIKTCRQHNVPIPQDDNDAKGRLGGYLMTASTLGRSDSVWNIRGAFEKICKEMAPHILDSANGTKKRKKKTVDAEVTKNQKLVDLFLELSDGVFTTNKFKGISLRKVANAIADLDYEVTDGNVLAKGKKKVAGVGKSSAKIINDILETGTCPLLEEVRAG
eukprot:g5043.t1